jgi:UDP-N-acetylglucosamine 2-epimerase
LKLRSFSIRLRRWKADRQLQEQHKRVEIYLRSRELKRPLVGHPVIFFNASTRISRLSMNAASNLLASWAVRLEDVPVRHIVCRSGMRQCMLGTKLENLNAQPPCEHCIRTSDTLFSPELVVPLEFDRSLETEIELELKDKSLAQLSTWEDQGLPLGELCLPSLGWALRRYHLQDDASTRRVLRLYLISAVNLRQAFERLLDYERPRALVVFNGITYPEAIARRVALRKNIPVITHEVGLRPFSAFFSHGDATFREVDLPPDYTLGDQEDERLDEYIKSRVQGQFTMAGIKFWPQMRDLPQELIERMCIFRQMVVVFTNVIFDTSQVHANTLYEDMFAWLDVVRRFIEDNKDTLFVIRAHPDEDRPGKASRESVVDWVKQNQLEDQDNVFFLSPSLYVSSYQLIDRAKFVMVYNSSIGLEASIMGAPVLCAGRARYTQVPTVIFPNNRQSYQDQLTALLKADRIQVPTEFKKNARRFLNFELYNASLDFSSYVQPYPHAPGNVTWSRFDPSEMGEDEDIRVLQKGILDGEPFALRG